MNTSEFSGHSSEMRDSPWLASEDLLERGEVTVTLDQCYQNKDAEFDGGRKEDCFSLAFIGKHKQLVLNSTNRRRLVNAYGPNVADWTGKEIVLHVEKVQAFGEMRNGIRIKECKR